MSYTTSNYLTSLAASDKKSNKLDPRAKVRSRGKVVFPAESPKVKDKKDHFPINDADQARNALARAGQYDKVPPWYKGTLTELKETVRKVVHKHYKGIEMKDKKASHVQQIIKQADRIAEELLSQPIYGLTALDIGTDNLSDLNQLGLGEGLINPYDIVGNLEDL